MLTIHFALRPLESAAALEDRVYTALREAIESMDIYAGDKAPKLDERRIAEELGVSRTPVREAISQLKQEGLVQTIPHRGAFVVRKTKAEILEIITVWAALESLAARLATTEASHKEIGRLREMFVTFETPESAAARIDEYSDTNIRFHQSIIALSKSELLNKITDTLFVHMRAIRARTIMERDRIGRSIIDHLHIIEALEDRDAELAERLVCEHCWGLANHINRYVDYLD